MVVFKAAISDATYQRLAKLLIEDDSATTTGALYFWIVAHSRQNLGRSACSSTYSITRVLWCVVCYSGDILGLSTKAVTAVTAVTLWSPLPLLI